MLYQWLPNLDWPSVPPVVTSNRRMLKCKRCRTIQIESRRFSACLKRLNSSLDLSRHVLMEKVRAVVSRNNCL